LVVAGVGAVVVSSGAASPSPAAAGEGVRSVSLIDLDSTLPPAVTGAPAPADTGTGTVTGAGTDAGTDTWTGVEAGDVGAPPRDRGANAPTISRDIDRATLQQQVELQAAQRTQALAELAEAAQQRANELRVEQRQRLQRQQERAAELARQWVLPVAGYSLTATFGESSYLWSTVHTGLDFAAAEGTPLVAVAQGTITATEYDGAYGTKTILTLDDGTEIWYCHQSSQTVSVGDVVAPGETIGAVGSTGNTTGPHLHLEVRPDGGDPVDPYAVLAEHGVSP
jgi:murein DD-endopeptidase MepM/ murein hydrolase activator NlpD